MSSKNLTRRQLLERGAVLSLVVVGGGALAACGGDGAADCTNPPGLTAAHRTQRQTLHYVDRGPDPARQCSACNFFPANVAAGQCGECTLAMGPVSAMGSCDSFAPRA